MPNFQDLTGQKFGRLTVLKRVENRGKTTYWECQCECGTIKEVWAGDLRTGKQVKSCGCLQKAAAIKRNTIHGKRHTDEYKIFYNIKNRCNNPNTQDYKYYGGRGVELKFNSFEEFLSEIGPRPSKKHSVGRIRNDGHYEPGNVRWETMTMQTNNASSNYKITFNNKTQGLNEWARELGFKRESLSSRLKRYGWSVECSLTTPMRAHKKYINSK